MAAEHDVSATDEVLDVARDLDGWSELVLAAGRSGEVTEDAYELIAKGLARAAERLRAACNLKEASGD